ncbi:acetylglutamate kinase [Oceanibacterium hippocampi]|uniref:Acetylglutamate kinase n=1 Tax=Oceanibacterium hippocampi TaxID=745714 RepID=A0A1Y5RTV1_9PROT|nr:acetylglutamate kinase [Oceanibacterium hippocampi]SLN25345.1 Acetylglutamate kinase [Oceanibacterium hippocampi]
MNDKPTTDGGALPAYNKDQMAKAHILAEALPYMRRFTGQTFVVKFGGHAMGDEDLGRFFAEDITLMKQVGINPVVVHGGGPQIGKMLERLKIQSSFIDGLRVTDKATVEIVEMVLSGSINKQIVTEINGAGGTAVGISGKDGRLIEARKLRRAARDPDSNIERILDLGFVGEPFRINPEILISLAESSLIPVIAPIGIGTKGETYNINADTAAGHIAAAIGASKLIMMTDVIGVLDEAKQLIPNLTPAEISQLEDDGVISGGMIPKLETCLYAVEHGVDAAHVLNGKIPHALLLEIFTEHGIGTMISEPRAADDDEE